VGSSVNLLCVMAEPTMRKGGYDVRMGAGSIAAAGTLGILIPPSIMLVVLGPMVGVPVTDLFVAAVAPGLLLASLYIGYSLVKCSIWPKYGPPLPPELRPKSFSEVMRELLVGAIPLLLLILSVLGSIMFILGFIAVIIVGALKLYNMYSGHSYRLVTDSPYFYLALTSMILGTLLFLAGFLGELIIRHSPDRNHYEISEEITDPHAQDSES